MCCFFPLAVTCISSQKLLSHTIPPWSFFCSLSIEEKPVALLCLSVQVLLNLSFSLMVKSNLHCEQKSEDEYVLLSIFCCLIIFQCFVNYVFIKINKSVNAFFSRILSGYRTLQWVICVLNVLKSHYENLCNSGFFWDPDVHMCDVHVMHMCTELVWLDFQSALYKLFTASTHSDPTHCTSVMLSLLLLFRDFMAAGNHKRCITATCWTRTELLVYCSVPPGSILYCLYS